MGGVVSSLFGSPKVKSPKPVDPPEVDEAQLAVDERRRRRTSSRSANQLVKSEGGVSTAARTLTGN